MTPQDAALDWVGDGSLAVMHTSVCGGHPSVLPALPASECGGASLPTPTGAGPQQWSGWKDIARLTLDGLAAYALFEPLCVLPVAGPCGPSAGLYRAVDGAPWRLVAEGADLTFAAGGGHVYWAHANLDHSAVDVVLNHGVADARTSTEVGSFTQAEGGSGVVGLARHSAWLFSSMTMGTTGSDGALARRAVSPDGSLGKPTTLGTLSSPAFWLVSGESSIAWLQREGLVVASLDGERTFEGRVPPDTIVQGDVAFGGDRVFVRLETDAGDLLCGLDTATGSGRVVLSTQRDLAAIATNSTRLFWVEIDAVDGVTDSSRLWMTDLEGASPSLLGCTSDRIVDIAADDTAVYWVTAAGALSRLELLR